MTFMKNEIKFDTWRCQPNKIVFNEFLNLIITGNEDKEIKFFDIRSNEQVSGFIGHTDAVSALSVTSNGLQLISGGHDGSVRYWDIRKNQCLQDLIAHWWKYDEGVKCLTTFPGDSLCFASGGADGVVKII